MITRLPLANEAATRQLGADLAIALAMGDLVTLTGEVGAGKSTLARALVRALADDEGLDVPSPTFTLAQIYDDGRLPVVHCDFYRLSAPDEAHELGLEDALRDGVVLVEWPERGELPPSSIAIELHEAEDGDERVAFVEARGDAIARVERSLAIRAFLNGNGRSDAARIRVAGDASTRSYERIEASGETLLLMDSPEMTDGPPVRNGLPYSKVAHLAENVNAFAAIGELLRDRGFRAPKLHAADLEQGLLLLEHLGSGRMVDDEDRPIAERYGAVMDVLAAMHEMEWSDRVPVPGSSGQHVVPPFDRGAMTIELELTLDWAFPRLVGRPATRDERNAWLAAWYEALDAIAGAETTLTLRDVQSTNVVWQPQAEGNDRVGLIDYQDALMGPAVYDVVSMTQDARVTVPEALEAELVARYQAARLSGPDPLFDTAYAVMAAQRSTKVFGLWVRLDERDGKPDYLAHMPRTCEYLRRNLRHPTLAQVRQWLDRYGMLDRAVSLAPAA